MPVNNATMHGARTIAIKTAATRKLCMEGTPLPSEAQIRFRLRQESAPLPSTANSTYVLAAKPNFALLRGSEAA